MDDERSFGRWRVADVTGFDMPKRVVVELVLVGDGLLLRREDGHSDLFPYPEVFARADDSTKTVLITEHGRVWLQAQGAARNDDLKEELAARRNAAALEEEAGPQEPGVVVGQSAQGAIRFCPWCGAAAIPEGRFCATCGSSLTLPAGTPVSQATIARSTSPSVPGQYQQGPPSQLATAPNASRRSHPVFRGFVIVWTILLVFAIATGASNVDNYYYSLNELMRDTVMAAVVWAAGLAIAYALRSTQKE
jgi:hypothetical protein